MDWRVILLALVIIFGGYLLFGLFMKSADWVYPIKNGGKKKRVKYLNEK